MDSLRSVPNQLQVYATRPSITTLCTMTWHRGLYCQKPPYKAPTSSFQHMQLWLEWAPAVNLSDLGLAQSETRNATNLSQSNALTHQERKQHVSYDWAVLQSELQFEAQFQLQLWSTRQQQCTGEIDMRANVCCAQFNPHNEHEICAGSADHCVHVFDLRHSQRPLHSFAGKPSIGPKNDLGSMV